MRESLVSINIVYKDKDKNELLNKSLVPILFYWNGETDVIEQIKQDKDFNNYISSICFNEKNYTKSFASYFYFTYNDDNEVYNENTISVQDLFNLQNMENWQSRFANFYIFSIFDDLYKTAFKEKYEYDSLMLGEMNHIKDIYEKLQNKFPNRFVKDTVFHYLRKELQSRYDLNLSNIEFLLKSLDEYLNANNTSK